MPRRIRAPQRHAAPGSTPASVATATSVARLSAWLAIALLVPRIVRILYPYVWVEDDSLLESAFAVSRGLRPYVDFTHAQMPLLEWVAGLYISLVGASHVAMEVLNGLAIYLTSVLVWVVGAPAVGRRAGAAAALLFACHSLVFRYHVWAREFFVTALVLGAVVLVLAAPRPVRRQVVGIALLLAAACAIKLTALFSAFAVLLFMAIGQRRPLRAVACALLLAAGILGVSAVAYSRYQEAFVFQAFLFHFLKGRDLVGAGPLYILSIVDVLGPLVCLGLWALAVRRATNEALRLVLTVGAIVLGFYVFISPTGWGHNFLEPLPFLAIVAGAGASWLIDAVRRSPSRAAIGIAVIVTALATVTPFWNENAERGSVYGFGFVPRAELASLATNLARATRPDEPVIAPSFIAFEANRLLYVRYPENYGVMRASEAAVSADGFWSARERFGAKGFFELINDTAHLWNDLVVQGIAREGPVNAFMADSTIQLLPLVDASPDALAARRFRLSVQTAHFALWLRTAGP